MGEQQAARLFGWFLGGVFLVVLALNALGRWSLSGAERSGSRRAVVALYATTAVRFSLWANHGHNVGRWSTFRSSDY